MNSRKLSVITGLALVASMMIGSQVAASGPQAISDSQLKALTTTVGGAKAIPGARTVAHWHGSTLDPSNGVTYGYNMVGANPNTCSGSACDVTVEADITPIIVKVEPTTATMSLPPRWPPRSSR
jgi:hypothetical protein